MGINATPKTWGTEDLVSSDLNAQVKGLWDGLQAPWDSYTPAWTSTGTAPSLGNGSRAGSYFQMGKTGLFRFAFQFGSTTTFGTGSYNFQLPFTPNAAQWDAIGSGAFVDNSASVRYGFTLVYAGSGYATIVANDGSRIGNFAPVVPHTGSDGYPVDFANGDRITGSGSCEIA